MNYFMLFFLPLINEEHVRHWHFQYRLPNEKLHICSPVEKQENPTPTWHVPKSTQTQIESKRNEVNYVYIVYEYVNGIWNRASVLGQFWGFAIDLECGEQLMQKVSLSHRLRLRLGLRLWLWLCVRSWVLVSVKWLKWTDCILQLQQRWQHWQHWRICDCEYPTEWLEKPVRDSTPGANKKYGPRLELAACNLPNCQ